MSEKYAQSPAGARQSRGDKPQDISLCRKQQDYLRIFPTPDIF
jgi:hypothetical protein